PLFLQETSKHEESLYMWAYRVQIQNNSDKPIQLRRRYWHIIDARGYAQEVRGVGVVGEQPKLEPGETYEYASGTALTTPSGIIQGTYEMETEEGEWLTVDIPPFSLDSPYQTVLLN
ncbi:MAG: Co2+/Mg2+ efflux protein ApaG, partial [Holosporales bacterium]|nr:Co2+/Mg2+ efflux protein ApaG [Holosporales bacterium]